MEYDLLDIKLKGFDFGENTKKKRQKMTPTQRIYVWEHPKLFGRTCSICHHRITKMSELEFDHTKAHSKGGKKVAIAHNICNRMKSSGSLGKIQKTMGFKTSKRKKSSKKSRRKSKSISLLGNYRPPKLNRFL